MTVLPRQTPRPTIIVGALAAAATTGALIAFGRRLGGPWLPFAIIGGALPHRTASAHAWGLILTGLAVHLALVFLWSALFVWLVRTRHWRSAVAAMAVVAAAHLFAWLIAWTSGGGIASVLALGDRLVLAVVFASALVVGMRFAFSVSQNA